MRWKNIFLFKILIILLSLHTMSWAAATGTPANANPLPEDILHPPPLPADSKIPVAVAFRLINLSSIDEEEQHFDAVGYLMAQWNDPRLAYTPKNAQDEYRNYKPGEVWMPIFDFGNAVVPHSAFDVTIRVFPDGTVRYFERSSAELSNNLYLHLFPFDTQKLNIKIQPTISQDNTVDLYWATVKEFPELGKKTAFSAEEQAFSGLAQWDVVKLIANKETIYGLGNVPIHILNLDIDVERRAEFYLMKVFLPLFMMVILSWTVFWIEPKELNSQVQISVTTILTVIAFSFAIASNLPKVPYITFIDAFFLASYFFVFITAIVITGIHILSRKKLEHVGGKIQHYIQILLPIAFFVTLFIILWQFNLIMT